MYNAVGWSRQVEKFYLDSIFQWYVFTKLWYVFHQALHVFHQALVCFSLSSAISTAFQGIHQMPELCHFCANFNNALGNFNLVSIQNSFSDPKLLLALFLVRSGSGEVIIHHFKLDLQNPQKKDL